MTHTKDHSSFDPLLTIGKEPIKFIGDDVKPCFKYLGRLLEFDLGDAIILQEISGKIVSGLKLIDSTPLTGPMKAWIANHYLCSKLAWNLTVHDFAETHVRDWQELINTYYRRWMGLAACAERSVLYRSNERILEK